MAATSFYTENLGLSIVKEEQNEIHLGVQQTVLLIVKAGAKIEKQSGRAGLYHFALLVPARKDLGTILQHLLASNTQIQGGADHLFSEAVYLSDPDGNGIEIYCDRPIERWNVGEDGSFPMVSHPLDKESLLKEAGDWEGLPDHTVMGHIHLHVNNLKQAAHFYLDLLGFLKKIEFRNQALFVASGDYHHHIGLNTWAGEGARQSDPEASGLVEYELQATKGEVMQIIQRLEEADYPFSKNINRVSIMDPAKNKLVLVY
ncbi:VOC family protein [Halobacillus campisalis]|uniref:VOC family protein n=1 Tax=Halobacillus campisalis TaxID=435909 RepID=A0ABW2K286_9BACI|nr:VOC family protein [Halobacillus campisalis]